MGVVSNVCAGVTVAVKPHKVLAFGLLRLLTIVAATEMTAGFVSSDTVCIGPISLSPGVSSDVCASVAVAVQPVSVHAALVATTELAAGFISSDTVCIGPIWSSPLVSGNICASVTVAIQPGFILASGLYTTTEMAAGFISSDTVCVGPIWLSPLVGGNVCASVAVAVQPVLVLALLGHKAADTADPNSLSPVG